MAEGCYFIYRDVTYGAYHGILMVVLLMMHATTRHHTFIFSIFLTTDGLTEGVRR